jgi:hypothetical protein
MASTAVLTRTGPDTWAAFAGSYQVCRDADCCGDTVYRITTMRFSDRMRHANVATLAEVSEAVSAWEMTGGYGWYPVEEYV